MSINLLDNISYKGKKPNFERDQFKTLALMKAYNPKFIDDGHVCYVEETGLQYQYKDSNEVDEHTGRWRIYNEVVDGLNSNNTTASLSANQGNVLNAKVEQIKSELVQKISDAEKKFETGVRSSGNIVIDTNPTAGSNNVPSSGGVFSELSKIRSSINDYNISALYPVNGLQSDTVSFGGNLYTIATAREVLPSEYRNRGVRLTFLNYTQSLESWQYVMGAWGDNSSWIQVTNFTEDQKTSLANIINMLKTDGDGNTYLSADGTYKEIIVPSLPEIPKAPVQSIAVNGEVIEPSEDGRVDINTGTGNTKSITINGQKRIPDESGDITITINETEVDGSLNADSTNAVSNGAVTTAINNIKDKVIGNIEPEIGDGSVTIRFYAPSGGEIASVEIPAIGGGGGDSDVSATKISLSSRLSKSDVKFGDSVVLYYDYDHINNTADDTSSTGIKATISILVKFGSTNVYEQTLFEVSKGSYSVDITKYLQLGATDVYVKATVINSDGKTQTKQVYSSVKTYQLSLYSNYNISNKLDGYNQSDTITIPYSINGFGNKTITVYLDGNEKTTASVIKSGTTNSEISIPLSDALNGKHTIQLRAELVVSDSLTIYSDTVYFEFYVGKSSTSRIAIKCNNSASDIIKSNEFPKLHSKIYESYNFEYSVYDPEVVYTAVEIRKDNTVISNSTIGRVVTNYVDRLSSRNNIVLSFHNKGTSNSINIISESSDIDLNEITTGLVAKFDANGRSNNESNPAQWSSNGINTTFKNFDWDTNGWKSNALVVDNNANLTIHHQPFKTDPTISGMTIELEYLVYDTIDRSVPIISCINDGTGFVIHPDNVYVGNNNKNVSVKIAENNSYKVAFVIHKKSESRLLEVYVNGVRSGAVQYDTNDNMIQSVATDITINSTASNLKIKNIRLYNRSLNDDELLGNYIIDRSTASEVLQLYQDNDVMDEQDKVSIEKIRKQGKSVMRIVGDVNLVNQTNNKKFEVQADVYFYSKYGKAYDFIAKRVGLRIQGTSSTTYPRKNYRIYLDRKKKYNTEFIVGGVPQESLLYSMRPGAKPASLFTIKADFAESSSTHNTGIAKLINDVWIKCGWLTPPQKVDRTVRIGVDGFPLDAWYDNDGSNVNTYLGKYNFNNDKSASAYIFGFEDVRGFNDKETLAGRENPCICLEFLNNSNKVGLFTSNDMDQYFAEGLEFRFPEDVVWKPKKGKISATESQKRAVQRLWDWIIACGDDHEKFAREVSDYFDLDSLCGWYIITEYFMMVDQRVKNMMLATWDGLKWYFIPYDNDTVLGVRNDGKLKYDYNIDHDSYDTEANTYCYAGHDSKLWNLVRTGLQDRLASTAQTLRGVMSKDMVLQMLNVEQMGNWSARIYNKDAEWKYITTYLNEGSNNYLESLQGSRYSHRTYIVQNRFDLLDSKYLAGDYRQDNISMYFSHKFSGDPREIRIKSSEKYHYGYGFTSGTPKQSGVIGTPDTIATLTLRQDLIINDPQYVYGASRMRELDLTNVAQFIVNIPNFNKCRVLKKLDISTAVNNTTLLGIIVDKCHALEELNISGQKSDKFNILNLEKNKRLKKLNASNTNINIISLAENSMIEEVKMPATITTLKLVGLQKLKSEKLILENPRNITNFWYDNCKHIDWETMFDTLPNVRNIRIVGINKTGGLSWLNKFMNKGGITADGSNTTICALVGRYVLDKYVEDSEIQRYRNHFPELDIRQPEYTVIKWYDYDPNTHQWVNDGRCMYNTDNNTGYGTINDYKVSGHLKTILDKRRKYLCKLDEHADVANICRLHYNNDYKYDDNVYEEDCTDANLHGAHGDIMMYEPRYWSKGITDSRNGVLYMCYSSNVDEPLRYQDYRIDTWDTVVNNRHIYYNKELSRNLNVGLDLENHLSRSISNSKDNITNVIKVSVSGYKHVKYNQCNVLTQNGTSDTVMREFSAYFTDESSNIIKEENTPHANTTPGDDWIADIPDNAHWLFITILVDTNPSNENDVNVNIGASTPRLSKAFRSVVTNSDNILDLEPEWVLHEARLIATDLTFLYDGKWRSIVPSNYKDFNNDTSYNYQNYCADGSYDQLQSRLLRRFCPRYDFMTFEDYNSITALWYASNGNTNTSIDQFYIGGYFTYSDYSITGNIYKNHDYGMIRQSRINGDRWVFRKYMKDGSFRENYYRHSDYFGYSYLLGIYSRNYQIVTSVLDLTYQYSKKDYYESGNKHLNYDFFKTTDRIITIGSTNIHHNNVSHDHMVMVRGGRYLDVLIRRGTATPNRNRTKNIANSNVYNSFTWSKSVVLNIAADNCPMGSFASRMDFDNYKRGEQLHLRLAWHKNINIIDDVATFLTLPHKLTAL